MRRRWLDRVPRGTPRRPEPSRPADQISDAPSVPVVPFLPVRCPECRSDKPKTTGAPTPKGPGRIRYHLCDGCGLKFHSVEIDRPAT